MVGIVVWQKVDMISWMLEGIAKNFPAERTSVHVVLDNPTDGSDLAFAACAPWWLERHGFVVSGECTDHQVYEIGGHDRLQRRFLASDADMLIVLQDDQQLRRPIVSDLEHIAETYGDKLGLIGGRDGYFRGYAGMTRSPWSQSLGGTIMPPGQFAERPYVNSGPIIYPRRVVETVGLVNTEFRAFYVFDEYAHRSDAAGFVNGVLSTDLTHVKFGRVSPSEVYDDVTAERDAALFKKLCG